MAKKAATTKAAPGPALTQTWFNADLGDTELVLREYADGVFVLDAPEPRVVLAPEHMQPIALAFVALAAAKGWTRDPA